MAEIRGKFVSTRTGRGIAGVIVQLFLKSSDMLTISYITGPSGKFKFEVEPLTYILKTFSTGGLVQPYRQIIDASRSVDIGTIQLGSAIL